MISHNLGFFNRSDRWVRRSNPGFPYMPSHLQSPIYQTKKIYENLRDLERRGSSSVLYPSLCTRIGSVFETNYRWNFGVKREFLPPANSSPNFPWTNERIKQSWPAGMRQAWHGLAVDGKGLLCPDGREIWGLPRIWKRLLVVSKKKSL